MIFSRVAHRILVLCSVLLLPLATCSSLTKETLYSVANGRPVFLMHYAPWCGHCKKAMPAWDKLIDEFKDSNEILVDKVDCTSDTGKHLCQHVGVQGYPTIMYGSVDDLQAYKGAREFEAFKEHAEKKVRASCSPQRRNLCSETELAKLEAALKTPVEDLQKQVSVADEQVELLEANFKTAVEQLQKQYTELLAEKDKNIEQVKNEDLKFAKMALYELSKESPKDEL